MLERVIIADHCIWKCPERHCDFEHLEHPSKFASKPCVIHPWLKTFMAAESITGMGSGPKTPQWVEPVALKNQADRDKFFDLLLKKRKEQGLDGGRTGKQIATDEAIEAHKRKRERRGMEKEPPFPIVHKCEDVSDHVKIELTYPAYLD